MIGIYKITSPNKKIYIGQAINIDKRWNQYNNLNKICIGPKLYNSLNKYGFDKHKFEIIEECTLKQLNKKETYWKKYYIDQLGWDKMLFCELYDRGGGPRSEETKQKMSETHQNYLTQPNIIIKRRINCKLSATTNVQLKAVQNTNWIIRNQKLSKSRKSRNIPIIQYDLDMNYIQEWPSLTKISKYFKTRVQNLNACLNGKYKTYMGYKWKYK